MSDIPGIDFDTKKTNALGINFRQPIPRAERKLREDNKRDSLTGLFNRRYVEEQLASISDQKEKVVILMVDIDHFKSINDTLGHEAGDLALKATSRTLQESVRSIRTDNEADIVGRWGGEEFLIILRKLSNLEHGKQIAENIRQSVQDMPLMYGKKPIEVTLSIGVSSFSGGEEIKKSISRADVTMYEAKNTGRNRVVVAE